MRKWTRNDKGRKEGRARGVKPLDFEGSDASFEEESDEGEEGALPTSFCFCFCFYVIDF